VPAKMRGKKTRLTFIDKIFLWLSYLLGFALLVSYLAPIIDPRKFWPVAFFGLAYPFLLIGNLILLGYWLLRKSKYILLTLVCIVLGWGVLKANFGFRFNRETNNKTTPSALRIMTYNAHNFKRYGAENDPQTSHGMLQMIGQERPDIIGIQEFFSRKRGQYALKDSMRKIMQSDHYFFKPFNLNTGRESTGLAIFSKYPIVNQGDIMLSEGGSGNQCVFADIKKLNDTIRYYNVHLQSIRFDTDDYTYLSKVSTHGKTDFSSSIRIGGKLKRAFMKRSEQVFKIKSHAAQCRYPYIIAGDFNDTPASFAVNQMAKGLTNAFCEKGSGFARTYNGSFPNYQIDYVMASSGFSVNSYHIVQKRFSDHYPVCSSLLLK
jgi:endonuclease/exonuclease/phosphatase family metal-dependent hydrolase